MRILEPIYAHNPARPAARAGGHTITYGRLCADVDAIAHWLLGQGLGALRAGLVQSTGAMPPAAAASGLIGSYAAALGSINNA